MRLPRFDPLHLAGWLFADLLLVLALVAMGDRGDPLGARAAALPRSGPSASVSVRPSPSRTGPRSVERTPVKVSISANVSDPGAIVSELRRVTQEYAGRQAAFVLTFGGNPDPGPAVAYAHTVNSLLSRARPSMFLGTTTRDFMDLSGTAGHADLEIYFYTF
jgi:hypothetical protein